MPTRLAWTGSCLPWPANEAAPRTPEMDALDAAATGAVSTAAEGSSSEAQRVSSSRCKPAHPVPMPARLGRSN